MESLDKVTAVLITREAEYPKKVKLEGFGEVIIRTNCPNIYERYVQAAKAKHDIIYVQDDDCIVDYRELFTHYDGHLTNAMMGRREYYEEVSGGRITLVGWGAFFPKSMLSVFDQYITKYGTNDPHLMREADRIFTWLNYPHNTIRMQHVDLNPPVTVDRMSNEPIHFTNIKEVAAKLEALAPRPRPNPLKRILRYFR